MGVSVEEVTVFKEEFVQRELLRDPREQLDRQQLEEERDKNEGGDQEDKDF